MGLLNKNNFSFFRHLTRQSEELEASDPLGATKSFYFVKKKEEKKKLVLYII